MDKTRSAVRTQTGRCCWSFGCEEEPATASQIGCAFNRAPRTLRPGSRFWRNEETARHVVQIFAPRRPREASEEKSWPRDMRVSTGLPSPVRQAAWVFFVFSCSTQSSHSDGQLRHDYHFSVSIYIKRRPEAVEHASWTRHGIIVVETAVNILLITLLLLIV